MPNLAYSGKNRSESCKNFVKIFRNLRKILNFFPYFSATSAGFYCNFLVLFSGFQPESQPTFFDYSLQAKPST